jgi:hypothetical protein
MSTPSVPTKPDVSADEPGTERRDYDGPARRERAPSPQPEVRRAAPSDRTVDADLLIDIPQLSVEELTVELDASPLLNHVKLDAKGLEAGLYLKANLDNVVALTQQDSGTPPARTGLRELLGATRDAYRDLSDRDVQKQLQGVHTSAREAYARIATDDQGEGEAEGDRHHDGNGSQPLPVRQRARHAVTQGAKAAGLTAAGLAGGALLESHSKPSRKLPFSGRSKRARVIRDAIAKRLP